MLTLQQLDEISQSPDHHGHIARTILSIISELKEGTITEGVAKIKISNIFTKYLYGLPQLPEYDKLNEFRKDFASTDLSKL